MWEIVGTAVLCLEISHVFPALLSLAVANTPTNIGQVGQTNVSNIVYADKNERRQCIAMLSKAPQRAICELSAVRHIQNAEPRGHASVTLLFGPIFLFSRLLCRGDLTR
jgi:hypothetical protein